MGAFFILFVLLDIFNNDKTRLPVRLVLIFGVIFLGIGNGFKLLHWQYGAELLMCSVSVITLAYIAQLVLLKEKGFEEYVKTLFVIILGTTSLAVIMRWEASKILTIMAMILFALYFGIVALKYIKRGRKKIINTADENDLN